ncbi:MAG TPA: hypothetical protein VK641_02135 [Terriglobales bacterium]|nr:hypothetical protein [Terriglobales bacterium]
MNFNRILRVLPCPLLVLAGLTSFSPLPSIAQAQGAQAPSPSSVTKPFGTVKLVDGNTITLTTNSGSEVDVLVQDSTRLVKTAPGQKDLKGATPIQLKDVQVGDRVLVLGTAADDGKSVLGSTVIVMKKTDIADKQQHDREDWQKRGMGGLVKTVDPATGTITISSSVAGSTKTIAVHTSERTIVRRYSPDSVKFDDAKLGTIDQIKAGDQLRARGNQNPGGDELMAEEIVSGTFRNIAGKVISTQPGKNTVSILDLLTKKPVIVQVTGDSQLRKLPEFAAQRIALRLRGISPETPGVPTAGASPSSGGENAPGTRSPGARQGGGADFQQMLARLPEVKLVDLQKDDAVIVVATQGTETSAPSAITLLSGVEPLLTASPTAASVLSPWSLGSGGDLGAQ